MRRLLPALLATALLQAAPARAGGAAGWAAYDAGSFAEAVRLWSPEAERGDVDAQFGLGIAYDLGQGVAPDALAACGWYRRAGAAGLARAAFNTAIMYDSARCGPRRADLAALWYGRAAGAGHPRAQFDLAQLYGVGDGVPRNPDMAASWFRAAAANGITAAAGRGDARPRAAPRRPLLPAIAAATADVAAMAGQSVVLVWTAPPQSGPVRFYVEVSALEPGGPREVFSRYVEESAVQVPLPPTGTHYAWRVLTVSAETGHYLSAPWQRLAARP